MTASAYLRVANPWPVVDTGGIHPTAAIAAFPVFPAHEPNTF
jgi:hypothetical protein